VNKIYLYSRREFKIGIVGILFWVAIPILYAHLYRITDAVTHDWSSFVLILLAPILGVCATVLTIYFCVKNLRSLAQESMIVSNKWLLYLILVLMFLMPYIGTKIALQLLHF
jgi:uncharacterized membrane protein YbhN (UPF0104 family)